MEKYKRAFMRHHKLIYTNREKRSYPFYTPNVFLQEPSYLQKDFPQYPTWLKRHLARQTHLFRKKREIKDIFNRRIKRALKSTGGSRTIGLGHKSGGSLNLRRGNNRGRFDDDEDNFIFEPPETPEPETTSEEPDITTARTKHQRKGNSKKKKKFKGPCEPLSSEPYVNIEVVKHGRDHNVTFSSGTIVKIACAKGYGSSLPDNKTAKCVRGKWRPAKPECIIRELIYFCAVGLVDYLNDFCTINAY